MPNIMQVLQRPDVIGSRRVRDHLRFWLSEDWQSGLTEVVNMPNFNVTKRYLMELKVNVTTSGIFNPATDIPADSVLPIIRELRLEAGNERSILKLPFYHIWFMSCVKRRGVSYISPFPLAINTTQDIKVMVEIDLSDYQDFGLDADTLDQIRLTIEWGLTACLGAQVTINSACLKIWYDERVRGENLTIHPILSKDYFHKTLGVITEGRIELAKGLRYQRLYLRLFSGTTPVKLLQTNLSMLRVEFQGDNIWGSFNGYEAWLLWHLLYGYYSPSFARDMWAWEYHAAALAGPPEVLNPLDRSYLIIDCIDVLNNQLAHGIDVSSSDKFDLVYSYAGAEPNPNMAIFADTFVTAADRVANPSSKLAQTLPETAKAAIMHKATISDVPSVTLPQSFDIADLIAFARKNFTEVQLQTFLSNHPRIKQMVVDWQKQQPWYTGKK